MPQERVIGEPKSWARPVSSRRRLPAGSCGLSRSAVQLGLPTISCAASDSTGKAAATPPATTEGAVVGWKEQVSSIESFLGLEHEEDESEACGGYELGSMWDDQPFLGFQ